MRLGVDLDGVISQLSFRDVARKVYPDRLAVDYVPTCWDYSDSGLTKAEIKAVWNKMATTEDFWLELEPYEDNVKALASHLQANVDTEVYYVTARFRNNQQSVMEQTGMWLERQGLHFPYRTSVVVVPESEDKAAIYKAVKVDYCIDDRWETHIQCWFKDLNSYLLKRPWNAQKLKDSRTRATKFAVDSLAEFLEIAGGKNCDKAASGR